MVLKKSMTLALIGNIYDIAYIWLLPNMVKKPSALNGTFVFLQAHESMLKKSIRS